MTPYLERLEKRFMIAFETGIGALGNIKYPENMAHKWALMYLFESMPNPRSQKEIVDWYARNRLGQYDRQLRHMAPRGWYLATGNKRSTEMVVDPNLKSDQICLVTIDKPNPITFHANRAGVVAKQDWEDKIHVFERIRGGCAVCGEKQTNYDRGHLDRSKGMELSNIVPMCSGCNNHGQRYGFDYKMHPKTLKVRPVPQGKGGIADETEKDL